MTRPNVGDTVQTTNCCTSADLGQVPLANRIGIVITTNEKYSVVEFKDTTSKWITHRYAVNNNQLFVIESARRLKLPEIENFTTEHHKPILHDEPNLISFDKFKAAYLNSRDKDWQYTQLRNQLAIDLYKSGKKIRKAIKIGRAHV